MTTVDFSKVLSSQRFDYPYIFDDRIGTNISIEPGMKLMENWDKNDFRHVNIKLSSFKNVIDNAKHYYCTFVIDGVSLFNCEKKSFVCQNNPLLQPQYKLRLYHPLTANDVEEKDANGNYRYNSSWYKVGDYVESFNTLTELFQLVLEVIKERFRGNWIFYLSGLDSKKDIIAIMDNNTITTNNFFENDIIK